MKERIAVLIPCLNEEKTIGSVIENFKKELPNATIYVFDLPFALLFHVFRTSFIYWFILPALIILRRKKMNKSISS